MITQESENGEIDNQFVDYLSNFENLPCGVAMVKKDGFSTLIKANSRFYDMIGHTKEELFESHQNHLRQIVVDDFQDIMKDQPHEKDYDFEWDLRVRTSSGEIKWIHDTVHYNAKQGVFYLIYTDITDKLIATSRRLSYDAFQTRNAIMSYLNLYTTEHITVVNIENDEVIYINPAASELLGIKNESDWIGKSYAEIAFGSKENTHPSYYKHLSEDEFIAGDYYNDFYKKYLNIKSKIINVPSINRKLCLNIMTDITAQKQLERKIEAQHALQKCVESMFNAATRDRTVEEVYYDILNEIMKYYNGDRAFFYKFKNKTHDIDAFYEIDAEGLKKVDQKLSITATPLQLKIMSELASDKIVKIQSVLDYLDGDQLEELKQIYGEHEIDSFACTAINGKDGDILAFMGVTNPQINEEISVLISLLSKFICMFIEYEHEEHLKIEAVALKEEASKLEAISKEHVVETCVENFQKFKNPKKSIDSTLDVLCEHYDAGFAVALMKKEDGTFETSYSGGEAVPDLTAFQNQGIYIMMQWTKMFGAQPKFASSTDFEEFRNPITKNALYNNFGIYNFIVAPIQDTNGDLMGLLFVNNFELLTRSRLMVHIVAKNISDYLARIKMYENTQLEPATKLTNKIATQNQISKYLADGKMGTLFIIDIDNFKELNDTLGHQTGDSAILDIANNLKELCRSTDIVGRVGGDEFMVYCQGLITEESIAKKSKQMLENCNLTYEKDKHSVEITVSIGVCGVDKNSSAFDKLYARADYSLYRAKKDGKNQYHIYHPEESNLEHICDCQKNKN